ncbi:hypothetical protein [Nocardioides convexus]
MASKNRLRRQEHPGRGRQVLRDLPPRCGHRGRAWTSRACRSR